MSKKKYTIIILLFLINMPGYTQNRGNDLSFQGIENLQVISAYNLALPASINSRWGDINGVFTNPAALDGLKSFTFNINGGNVEKELWENQSYRPNRLFVTLPFYLEGLYIPDPANNGLVDSDVFNNALLDTSYVVSEPEMGLDRFGKEAADWIFSEQNSGPTAISLGYPIHIGTFDLSLAAGYGKLLNTNSYDRNKTYLDPHMGYKEYDMPESVSGIDTVRINWYDFQRYSSIDLSALSLGFGISLNKNISIGFGLSKYFGTSREYQYLDKIGYFDLIDDNEFIYSYDTLNTHYKGSADYSGLSFRTGLSMNFDHFAISGFISNGAEIEKNWSYDYSVEDTSGIVLSSINGTDYYVLPFEYGLSLYFYPNEKFAVQMGYNSKKYSSSTLESAFSDSASNTWVDQNILSFGVEYTPFSFISFRAGYQSEPQVFVPDGAPIRDQGPIATAYSAGIGINIGSLGVFDVAYQLKELKYEDIYSTNTNHVSELMTTIMIGYTVKLK